MTRIATAAENNLIQFYMQQNQSQLDQLNAQVSTGFTSETYAGIAPQASQLVDFRAQASQQQDYINTINTVSTRMQTMDLALGQIQQQVQSFSELIPNAAYGAAQPSFVAQAQLLLQQVAGFLNTQDGTRYVFSGVNSDTPPVNLASLPTAAASLTTPVNGTPANGGYYAGGTAIPPVRIAQQVTVNYGITANDASTFEPIIRVLNYIVAKGPFSSTSAADQTSLSTMGQMLTQALQSLTTMQGNFGLQESQINTSLTEHQSALNIAQNGVSNIVNVNQATAITQLQSVETQIEASYTATSQIQKLSLANYLT
jgi:flagellar hook-associated protein 3 FlgL